jgi:hypothetical protein
MYLRRVPEVERLVPKALTPPLVIGLGTIRSTLGLRFPYEFSRATGFVRHKAGALDLQAWWEVVSLRSHSSFDVGKHVLVLVLLAVSQYD